MVFFVGVGYTSLLYAFFVGYMILLCAFIEKLIHRNVTAA